MRLCQLGGGPVNDSGSVPFACGHGCCVDGPKVDGSGSSLLGVEFVEYMEERAKSGLEVAAIARELSDAAWIRSGLTPEIVMLPGFWGQR